MTKAWVLVSLLALAGAGTAVLALGDGTSDEVSDAAASEPPQSKDKRSRATTRRPRKDDDRSDWPVEKRVRELEQEVRELRAMVGMRRFAAAAGEDGDWEAVVGAAESAGEPAFREAVREVVEEDREERREQRRERQQERFEERTQQWLAALSAVGGGLTPQKQEALQQLWTTEREQMMSLVQQGRSGDISWQELRPQMRQLRDQSTEQMRDLLDSEQLQKFEELREEDRGWGRGRGDRGERRGG